jgi:hypothetical protein
METKSSTDGPRERRGITMAGGPRLACPGFCGDVGTCCGRAFGPPELAREFSKGSSSGAAGGCCFRRGGSGRNQAGACAKSAGPSMHDRGNSKPVISSRLTSPHTQHASRKQDFALRCTPSPYRVVEQHTPSIGHSQEDVRPRCI